ncbi:MAG: TMEM165/GDT1 family protein [Magnetococcales bacterium]|nr:TMEM165/GDT1 family protein [Magnetococcales bacterium]
MSDPVSVTTAASASAEWAAAAGTTFGLIFLAEIGDKTQLVCMTLAARHRPWPVLIGAIAAFVLLNTLAVVFGAGLAQYVPEKVLAGVVAALFAVFGVLSLRAKEEEEGEEEVAERSGHGIFLAAFLMIFLAEMGDKTQLAVAGMASTLPSVPVWVGGTLALAASSVLGVVAGRKLLTRIPLPVLHKVSGVFFLALAAFALTRVF